MNEENATTELVSRHEIDQQVSTAKQYPRDISGFLQECRMMCTLNDKVAASCIYSIPRSGKMIEGPSSRFAEVALSAWGNSRAGARVIGEDRNFVTSQAIFHDLEKNVSITIEVRRRITDRNGKRFGDDMIAVTGNAASSIALRNAVLKGIPKAFWADIYDEARSTAMGDSKTLETRRADAIEFLSRFGVTEKMVCAALGVRSRNEISLENLANLRGMATSLKDGEASVETLFGDQSVPQAKTVEDLVAAAVPSQEPAEKPVEEPAPEWPKGSANEITGVETWTDSRGVVFSHDYHAMGQNGIPSVTQAGIFRRRRGADPAEVQRYEQEQQEAPQASPQASQQEAEPLTYPVVMHAIQRARDRDTLIAASEMALAFAGPEDQKQELLASVEAVANQLDIKDLPTF